MSHRSILTLSVLLAVVLGAPAFASNSQPTPLGETIDVRVVNVEAVVTDRFGVRVAGMKKSDFRLLVDGVETEIKFFSEVHGGDVVERSQNGPEAGGLVPGEPLGTSYLVFIDEFFTLAADRRRVLRSLAGELDFLAPEDRMAVVAWNGRRLEMLTSWSQSSRHLGEVLRLAMDRPSGGLHRLAELRQFEVGRNHLAGRTRYNRGFSSFNDQRLDIEERNYFDLLNRQLEGAVSAATATLRGFAMPPGRKVMLALAGSWPERPADYVVGNQLRMSIDYLDTGGSYLYGPLTDTANLLGYTLYPVDVHGFEGSADTISAASSTERISRSRNSDRELSVHYGLEHLARETGGIALLNGMRERPLENVFADTRSFYWIGFSPERAGDDSRHVIRLELLSGERLKLRSRRGYVDRSRGAEAAMAVESALLFGQPSTAQDLRVSLGTPHKAGFGRIEVPLTIVLPTDRLTFLPEGDEWVGRLELRVAAMDSKGHRSDVSMIPIEVRRSSNPEDGEVFTYQTTLKMRPRDHEMVVALLDSSSGEIYSSGATLAR